MLDNARIANSMKIRLGGELPPKKPFVEGIRRAPVREFTLSEEDTVLALKNALRYVPPEWHEELIPEFLEELLTRGRIYGIAFALTGRSRQNPSMSIKEMH